MLEKNTWIREGEEDVWSAIELVGIHSLCIHCARWLSKRGDICCGFRTIGGLIKEIATVSYILVAIPIL